MATKHLYNETEGLVVKALRGIISYNPSLSLIEDEKVVYDTTHSPSNVSIICGGGAGHEPGWAGYVGTNMLAAGVMGDVFASPRRESVVCAIDRVSSDEGVILVVANYTGMLNSISLIVGGFLWTSPITLHRRPSALGSCLRESERAEGKPLRYDHYWR